MSVDYPVKVPALPPGMASQSSLVTLVRYLVEEGESIHAGTEVAVVENWWATMRITAAISGVVSQLLLEPGAAIRVGDPIAIVTLAGNALPPGPHATARIVEMKRAPGSRGGA